MLLARTLQFANGVVMCTQSYMHVGRDIACGIRPIRGGGFEWLQRFLTPVHPLVGNRQTNRRSAAEALGSFVQRNSLIETSHFAIQCAEQRLAIGEYWVELQGAFAGRDRFVVKAEVTVKLACRIVHPQ